MYAERDDFTKGLKIYKDVEWDETPTLLGFQDAVQKKVGHRLPIFASIVTEGKTAIYKTIISTGPDTARLFLLIPRHDNRTRRTKYVIGHKPINIDEEENKEHYEINKLVHNKELSENNRFNQMADAFSKAKEGNK